MDFLLGLRVSVSHLIFSHFHGECKHNWEPVLFFFFNLQSCFCDWSYTPSIAGLHQIFTFSLLQKSKIKFAFSFLGSWCCVCFRQNLLQSQITTVLPHFSSIEIIAMCHHLATLEIQGQCDSVVRFSRTLVLAYRRSSPVCVHRIWQRWQEGRGGRQGEPLSRVFPSGHQSHTRPRPHDLISLL